MPTCHLHHDLTGVDQLAPGVGPLTLVENDHWCTPGCESGCDIGKVRYFRTPDVVICRSAAQFGDSSLAVVRDHLDRYNGDAAPSSTTPTRRAEALRTPAGSTLPDDVVHETLALMAELRAQSPALDLLMPVFVELCAEVATGARCADLNAGTNRPTGDGDPEQ